MNKLVDNGRIYSKGMLYALPIYLYFLLPKINLILILNYGIRVQDFISLVMCLQVLIYWRIVKAKLNNVIYWLAYLFYLLAMGSAIGVDTAFLESFRILQYILIGYYLCRNINEKIIAHLIGFQFAVGFLQYFLMIPNFDTGRGIILSHEYSGTFGVRSEFTFAILLLLSYLNIGNSKFNIISLFAMLNGTLSSSLIYFRMHFCEKKIYKNLIFMSAFMGSIILPSYVIDVNIINLIGTHSFGLSDIRDFSTYGYENGEMLSLIQRSSKAIGLMQVIFSNPLILLGGYGFGAVFSPVDYGLLRLLANFGIIGILIFYKSISQLPYRRFVAILISMIMFDGLWSSTVSPLIFMMIFDSKFNLTRSHPDRIA